MNGQNKCCPEYPLSQDPSGDKICTGCGTIIDPAILIKKEDVKTDAE